MRGIDLFTGMMATMKRIALAIGISLALGACKAADKPAQPSETAAADSQLGILLSEGRLVLPTVKGNPGAAYFKLANGSAADNTIAAVDLAGAGRAEMHETSGTAMTPLKDVVLKAGSALTFEPGGKHVMVFDIDPATKAGAEVELTLTFADGDKLSAPLKVEAPGMAMEHMH